MNNRPVRIILFIFSLFLVFSSCRRINESTSLGDNIIPGVDGVNTFDTTLSVVSFNEIFADNEDSIRVGRNDDHLLGNITSDPFFGRTSAKIFLELKPEFYKWRFSNIFNPDSLFLDSVVMVLGWKSTYGDTTAVQRMRVYEIDQSNEFKIDSFYLLREPYFTYSNLLGTKDIYPYQLNDSVKVYKDTTSNQLRIRLSDAFGNRLLDYDTLTAYESDSAFKTKFRGFAIEADQNFGNALMSFGLVNEPNTKLAIYYRYQKDGKIDTTVDYFRFSGASARHNYIERFDFTGTPLISAAAGAAEDPLIYLINAPGSYARLQIPGLQNLSTRIIHRAELIVEEVYDVSDNIFTVPQALFLDVYDSSRSKYKVVPYDYVPDATGVSQAQFGMFGKNTTDGGGNPIRVWKFNITRYVQNILTGKEPLHNFRLLTHRFVFDEIKEDNANNGGGYVSVPITINSNYAVGRVRVRGGNNATQRMRLRIVYSKI